MSRSSHVANLFSVQGIVAVVTGGGGGLGLCMARALAENGAKKVYIVGRRLNVLEEAVKDIGLDNMVPLQGDVTNRNDLLKIVEQIQTEVGYINLLVANSGIAGPSGDVPTGASIAQLQKTLLDIPMEEFTNTYHVNCTSVFYTAIAFLGLLDQGNKVSNYQGGRSQIIATSSIGSFNRKITAGFAYGTSKASTTLMLKILATYLVPYRIRANVLCPGIFPTDLTSALIKIDDRPYSRGCISPGWECSSGVSEQWAHAFCY